MITFNFVLIFLAGLGTGVAVMQGISGRAEIAGAAAMVAVISALFLIARLLARG